MGDFQQLDAVLAGDYSGDYWADEVVLMARDIVERLTPPDWASVRTAWRSRSSKWQIRFADVLSRGPAHTVSPILVDMMESDDDEVVITAADSLRTLDCDLPPDILTGRVRLRLGELAKQSSLKKRVVDQLVRKLKISPQSERDPSDRTVTR